MVRLNRLWWEHLAPKSMHRRLREMEQQLSRWCETDYGRHWLNVARKPEQALRLFPGQLIPVEHFVAIDNQPIFIVPQRPVSTGPDRKAAGQAANLLRAQSGAEPLARLRT